MNLSFDQQLLLTIVDKLIIAGALVLVGFWLNRRLEGFKSAEAARLEGFKSAEAARLEGFKSAEAARLQTSLQIAAARLPAYQKFWEIQALTAKSLSQQLTPEQIKKLEDDLRLTFFKDGNGIFLSHEAFNRYWEAITCLQKSSPPPSFEEIQEVFSSFRSQLKLDVRVYNEEEARKPTLAAAIPSSQK
jgi:hypothetical protein